MQLLLPLTEHWLPVVGYKDRYEVSNLGRVRGVKGVRIPSQRRGYLRLGLRNSAGKPRFLLVHILVLEAFVGPRPHGKEARHLNGDRSDARLTNLVWGTREENDLDKARHGTHRRGGRRVLTDASVVEMRARRAAGWSISALAREFGLGESQTSDTVAGRAHRHAVSQ